MYHLTTCGRLSGGPDLPADAPRRPARGPPAAQPIMRLLSLLSLYYI